MEGKSPAGTSNHHMASQADANYPSSLPSQDPYLLGDPSLGVRGSQAWPATQASQASDPFLTESHPSQVQTLLCFDLLPARGQIEEDLACFTSRIRSMD